MSQREFYGKNPKQSPTPSIVLCNPKYAHNVGSAIRAASCFGVKSVWFTGDRVSMVGSKGYRLPREERMRGYRSVELHQFDYPLEHFSGAVPVAVELRKGSELLPQFDHPERAVYLFGPEDGSIPSVLMQHCHRFVVIPTRHCVNLAAAVYITLYDRLIKRQMAGLDPVMPMCEVLAEDRGWVEAEVDTLSLVE